MANFGLHLCILTVLATLFLPIESLKPENQSALFVFGDSLYDSGNNQYWHGSSPNTMGHFPYGETYFKRPSGRVCDGRIVPDFIASFARLPIVPPYLKPGEHDFTYGTNFASAGAGVLVETHPNISITLRLQVSNFKKVKQCLEQKLGDAEASKLLKRAVYLFSIGSNDYFVYWQSNPNNSTASSQREYSEMVIRNLTNILKEMYGLGVRKVAFHNIGPLGCVPSIRALMNSSGECADTLVAIPRRHNRMLAIALKKLKSELPGLKYSIFDFYNALYDRIKNPSKYGFKVVKEACCGSGPYRGVGCGMTTGKVKYSLCSNPSQYIFFDPSHPTEMANSQMAKLFWNGPHNFTRSHNLKQLFKAM